MNAAIQGGCLALALLVAPLYADDSAGSPVLVNVNTADAAQLRDGLGLSDEQAAAIEDYRPKHEPFRSAEDLKKVPEFTPKAVDELKPRLEFNTTEIPATAAKPAS